MATVFFRSLVSPICSGAKLAKFGAAVEWQTRHKKGVGEKGKRKKNHAS